jgi:voltage-gated potassium channel
MGWTRWLRLVALVGMVFVLYFVAPVDSTPHGGMAVRTLGAVLVLLALAVSVGWQLRSAAADSERRVDGLVVAIAGVLAVFAFAFYALDVHVADQVDGLLTRLDGLYFSASTMLTIGYGDVHATGQVARFLVLVQMVFDVVFVASAAGLLTARVRRVAGSRSTSR